MHHKVVFIYSSMSNIYSQIRKTAATKLFECILIYDVVEPELNSELSDLLSETVW